MAVSRWQVGRSDHSLITTPHRKHEHKTLSGASEAGKKWSPGTLLAPRKELGLHKPVAQLGAGLLALSGPQKHSASSAWWSLRVNRMQCSAL